MAARTAAPTAGLRARSREGSRFFWGWTRPRPPPRMAASSCCGHSPPCPCGSPIPTCPSTTTRSRPRYSRTGAPLAADGSSIFRAGAIVTLLPIPAPDAKEMTPAGPERLTYSFYATQGSLSALRSTDTTATGEPGIASVDWTAPSLPGRVRFWVVGRDGRGGAGWLVRDVQVVP